MLAILRRRVWWLILPPVVGLFAALIVSAKLHNMYLAETLMRLIPQRVPESYVRSTVILPIANRLESVSREVLSQTQIEQLIGEFDLYPNERSVLPMQDVVNKARAAIDVEMVPPPRGQMPDAFHIRFTYPDPVTAARVTDRLGALFVNENARDRGDLANATSEFLESQLADARTRLEAQEQKLETFRQRHAGRLPSQLESNSEAAHNAQMQVQAVVESAARDRDRKLMLERMYRDAEAEPVPVVQPAAPAAPLAPRADNTNAIAMAGSSQQQLAMARATLASLELRLKPEHPDIVRTQRQISELEKKVAAEAAAAKIQAETQTATETQPIALRRWCDAGSGTTRRAAASDAGGARKPRPADRFQGKRRAAVAGDDHGLSAPNRSRARTRVRVGGPEPRLRDAVEQLQRSAEQE